MTASYYSHGIEVTSQLPLREGVISGCTHVCAPLQALSDHKVLLEGTLLKPNMVSAGQLLSHLSLACTALPVCLHTMPQYLR